MRYIDFKNPKTGKAERIPLNKLNMDAWGFSFQVEDEMTAYKVFYAYRNGKPLTMEYLAHLNCFLITVWKSAEIKDRYQTGK